MSQCFSSSHQHSAAADQNAVGVNKDLWLCYCRCSGRSFLERCQYLFWAWSREDPVYSETECSSSRALPRPPLRWGDPLSGSGSDCHPAGKPGHRSLLSQNPKKEKQTLSEWLTSFPLSVFHAVVRFKSKWTTAKYNEGRLFSNNLCINHLVS